MRFVCFLVVSLAVSAVVAPTVRAQDPYGCLHDLEEAELEARLALVDRRLQDGKQWARAWWYGWQAIFGGVFAYQLGSAIRSDAGSARWANYIGTVGAFLALAQMWILPQPAATAPQRYRRMPTGTRAEREAKLTYGLDRLETAAAREQLGRGPLAHATPLLWSAVWATTLSVKFDDPGRVALLVVGGFVITQARIWTTPQAAIADWSELSQTMCQQDYGRRGRPEGPEDGDVAAPPAEPAVRARPGPSAQVAPFFGGMQLLVSF